MLVLLLAGLLAPPAASALRSFAGASRETYVPPWKYMEPMPWDQLRELVPALRDGTYLSMPLEQISSEALASDPAPEYRNRSRLEYMYNYCRLDCAEPSDLCQQLCGVPNRWKEMQIVVKLAMDAEVAGALRGCRAAAGGPCRSHSQWGEDAGLYGMFFQNRSGGSYVELGALDGVTFSNSLLYEEALGWRGVLIEPSPTQFAKLRKSRGEARNFAFNNAACLGNATLQFQDCGATGFLIRNFTRTDCPEVPVRCRTLGEMIGETALEAVDLLSLDVEGREGEVLLSFDWRVPVHVLLIERHRNGRGIEQLLLSKGFRYVRDLMGSHVFVNRTWEQLPAAE